MSLFKKFIRLTSLVLFLYLIVAYVTGVSIHSDTLAIIVIACSLCQLGLAFTNDSIYRTGTAIMFLLYNVVCHNGFVIAYYFNNGYEEFKSITSMDFLLYSESYQKAIIISNIVLFVFVFFLEVNKKYSYKETARENNGYDLLQYSGANKIDKVGIPLLVIGTAYIASIALTYNLMGAGYSNFLAVAENLPLYGHFVVLNSLSIAFIIASGSDKGVKISVIVFIIQAIFQFSMGNRGEIMYSAVVCIALITLRYKKISLGRVALLGTGFMFLIPYIRYMRELNQGGFNPALSILDTLCEEGMQISPFTHIVEYVNKGHNYVFGMTYVNDFCDFIFRRFGGASPFETEKYVIKMIMPYKGMGFSMIAELYYNFSIIGASLIYGYLAKFLSTLDYNVYNNLYSNSKKAFYSMLVVQFINMTRNDGSTLPIYLMYMIIIMSLYSIISRQKV